MYVYVLNKHGEPLMPCKPRKARVLLQSKKATVIKKTPFTIQLKYGSSGYKQPISLGVDAGSKHIGIAATTENRECREAVENFGKQKMIVMESIAPEQAVKKLDALGHDWYVFKNRDEKDTVCVVYKRFDGDFGMVVCK